MKRKGKKRGERERRREKGEREVIPDSIRSKSVFGRRKDGVSPSGENVDK
jgi:hypothetical protein